MYPSNFSIQKNKKNTFSFLKIKEKSLNDLYSNNKNFNPDFKKNETIPKNIIKEIPKINNEIVKTDIKSQKTNQIQASINKEIVDIKNNIKSKTNQIQTNIKNEISKINNQIVKTINSDENKIPKTNNIIQNNQEEQNNQPKKYKLQKKINPETGLFQFYLKIVDENDENDNDETLAPGELSSNNNKKILESNTNENTNETNTSNELQTQKYFLDKDQNGKFILKELNKESNSEVKNLQNEFSNDEQSESINFNEFNNSTLYTSELNRKIFINKFSKQTNVNFLLGDNILEFDSNISIKNIIEYGHFINSKCNLKHIIAKVLITNLNTDINLDLSLFNLEINSKNSIKISELNFGKLTPNSGKIYSKNLNQIIPKKSSFLIIIANISSNVPIIKGEIQISYSIQLIGKNINKEQIINISKIDNLINF